MRPLSIIIDNRERNDELIEGLLSMDIDISFSQLPVGDYILSDRMCVERKTARDFEMSIIDSRLFEQAERLSRSFAKPIIILEGESEAIVKRNAFLGALSRLYTDYNILVMPSHDAEDTAYILSRLAEMERYKEKRELRLKGKKKAYTFYQAQSLVLCSLPGVGPRLASHLIRHFGSVKNVANASIDELSEVEKIGPKKAMCIRDIFNIESKE